jgi:homopolymeric O-antigen transport system ATP-binding protein
MSDVVIRVENLGKRYHIGGRKEAYGTLRDALVRAMRTSLRALRGRGSHHGKTEIWALRDLSFELKRGEVLGIIGPNGAGKSTLLKILSRVTRPTVGRAWIHGRVGSLLEVGTGFHPELTGRENIYLNGAVLGMTKAEIDHKFDEIIEFAEIDAFLDTPVKRYSSGMYMRLAFSIAAHLEPEILLVDEVLAVGDAAFQKKCLGKMGKVAHEGRTVLFVSHNLQTIQALCQRAFLLQAGKIIQQGPTADVVRHHLQSQVPTGTFLLDGQRRRTGDGSAKLASLQIESTDPGGIIRSGSRLKIVIAYRSEKPVRYPQFVVSIYDQMDIGIFVLHNEFVGGLPESLPPEGSVTCLTEPINLTPGRCGVHVELLKGNVRADYVSHAGYFDVEHDGAYGSIMLPERDWALCLLKHQWWFNEE